MFSVFELIPREIMRSNEPSNNDFQDQEVGITSSDLLLYAILNDSNLMIST